MSSFEWAANAGLNFKAKRKFKIKAGDYNQSGTALADYDQEIDSKLDYTLGLQGQYNLLPSLSFGLNVAATVFTEEEITSTGYNGTTTKTSITQTNETYTDIAIGLNVKFLVLDNLMLGLSYTSVIPGDFSGKKITKVGNAAGTRSNANTESREENRLGFQMSTLF